MHLILTCRWPWQCGAFQHKCGNICHSEDFHASPALRVVEVFFCLAGFWTARALPGAQSAVGSAMAASSSSGGGSLAQLYLDYARPHKVLSKEEAAVAAKLCEVGKAFLWQRAKDMVKESGDRAILFSYGSDGTPVLTQLTIVRQLSEHQNFSRRAGDGTELLVERAFVKFTDALGKNRMTCLFRDPRPMSKGKSTWHQFTAACEFFPLLRTLGHEGIVVSSYCFDRAGFSALEKKMRQRHTMYYEVAGRGEDRVGQAAIMELTDWVVSAGCANHDCQNGLKWGLAHLAPESEQVIRKLHIVIEATRNAFGLIHARLKAFVVASLRFVRPREERQDVWGFWVSLGVEVTVAESLADLDLHWREGQLLVSEAHIDAGGVVERISDCLLYVLRFKKFTDSRWCTVGDSCRSLVASLCLGLQGLAKVTRSDPTASEYHLHGFDNLTPQVIRYAIAASLSANICDAVLVELLADARVALRLEHLQTTMLEELTWLADMSPFSWSVLPGLVDCSAATLRSDTLRSANISAGCIHRKVFRVAQQLPWSLVRGDVRSNLQTLMQGPPPSDDTSLKIFKLMQVRFSPNKLVEGIARIADVPWTTSIVEQGHGSAATLHRAHPLYGVDMLCQRAHIHMMACLFNSPAMHRGAQRAQERLADLTAKKPNNITGRHIFLADCVETARSMKGQGTVSQSTKEGLMRGHASTYRLLDATTRRMYEARAAQRASARAQAVQDEIDTLTAAQQVKNLRQAAECDEDQHLLRIANCRFTQEELACLTAMFEGPDFSTRGVIALRKKATAPPESPSETIRLQLESFVVCARPSEDRPVPSWRAAVCKGRGAFGLCALVLRKEGQEQAFAFLYGVKSPYSAAFLPLRKQETILPASAGCSPTATWQAVEDLFEHQYTVVWGNFVFERDLPTDELTSLWVLPHLVFLGRDSVASHASMVPLEEFVGPLPESQPLTAPRAARAPHAAVDQELLAQFPWLAECVGATASDRAASRAAGATETSEGPAPLEEDEALLVFQALDEKRRDWAGEEYEVHESFKTSIGGGSWTQAHLGVPFDCVRGAAVSKEAQQRCTLRHLPRTASFAFGKFGDALASGLALYYCQRLQYFYSLSTASGAGVHAYSENEIAAAPKVGGALAEALSRVPETHPGHSRAAELAALLPR